MLGLTRTDLQFWEGKYDTTDLTDVSIEEVSRAQSLWSGRLQWRSAAGERELFPEGGGFGAVFHQPHWKE